MTDNDELKRQVVSHIEKIIRRINSGQPFNWNNYDYEDWLLIEIWRDAETQHKRELAIYPKLIFQLVRSQGK